MFYRNLFASLLAVAAIGVKGSPIEPGDNLGTVKFCINTFYQEPCAPYSPGHSDCNDLFGEFNNNIRSFIANGPRVYCVLYT